jgi:hypothetical protein
MDVGVQIDSLPTLMERLKGFDIAFETLGRGLPSDKSYFCACGSKHFLKGGNGSILARSGNTKFLLFCENGVASAVEVTGFFSKSISTLWHVDADVWREAEEKRELGAAGLMQDVHRFEANLFPQVASVADAGKTLGKDGDLWFTGYYQGAFYRMFRRWSLRGDAASDLRSNLIFGEMEALMGIETARRRFEIMLQYEPYDPEMPTYMKEGFDAGNAVVSELAEGQTPKKLEGFFAAKDNTGEMGIVDEDGSLIERAISVASKVIELQIGLASAFRESKRLERLPEELPLDEYCIAYVVGVSRGSLISIAGGDVSEANDWAIMTLSIHHFFGPVGSKQADQGGKAVKFFLATQETQLSMRGQMEGGEDAFAIAEGRTKAEDLPKSLAAYLSEG